MSVEEIRPETPGRRNYLGWVVLSVIFGLLILNSVANAVRPKEKSEAYATENALLRSVASNVQALDMLPGANPADRKQKIETIRAGLDDPISNVVDEAEKKPAAARIYAVMRTEQGKDIPAQILKVLKDSKDPLDQTYYEIYSSAKLDPVRAERLALAVPKQPFANELAGIHALEKGGSQTVRSDRISPWYVVRLGVILFFGFGLFACGIAVWGVYLAGRKSGRYAPKGHPIGRVTLPDADRLALRGAQIMGAFLAISVALDLFARKGASPLLNIVPGIGILAFIVAMSKLPLMGKRVTLADLGVSRQDLGKNILWGIGGFLAEIPVTAALALLGTGLFSFLPMPSHPANDAINQAGGIMDILPILFMASILAPLWEEILFRGILFPALGRVSGSVVSGALYSSLLFGFIHPQGPALAFALAGVGAVSCGLAYQTRSLIPSMVLHILHNTALMIATLLML